jgi:superfamily II DNA/RNA helicase
MAPTRELADQIFKETKSIAYLMGLNVVCIYGGAGLR